MEPLTSTAALAAWHILHRCNTSQGLLASPIDHDNYHRIWARDSIIGGLTGVLAANQEIAESLKHSVLTLLEHQAQNGQIPSNVGLGSEPSVSFGTLAGRVDATSWWVIGACIMLRNAPDPLMKARLREPIQNALAVLKTWEMNQRGLVFTPLGGNWADEYISQGYVLYDQCLRLWALRLAYDIFQRDDYANQSEKVEALIVKNYFDSQKEGPYYHPLAYHKANPKPYFWFQLGPQGYDTRWDMAANALVLLLDLHPKPNLVEDYLQELSETVGSWLLPAFYPVIQSTDPEWHLLAQNYLYTFKNQPYHFHNGGSWPVFMGLLALGLSKQGLTTASKYMHDAVLKALEAEEPAYSFHEYWSGDTFLPGGVTPLSYTASGYLMLHHVQNNTDLNLTALLP